MPGSIVIGGEQVSPEYTNAVLRARALANQEAQAQQQMALQVQQQRMAMQQQAMQRQAFEQKMKEDAEKAQWDRWRNEAEAVAYREGGTPQQKQAFANQDRQFTEGVRQFDVSQAGQRKRWEAEQARADAAQKWNQTKYDETLRRKDQDDLRQRDIDAHRDAKADRDVKIRDVDARLNRLQQDIAMAQQLRNVAPQAFQQMLAQKDILERQRNELAYTPLPTTGTPGVFGPPDISWNTPAGSPKQATPQATSPEQGGALSPMAQAYKSNHEDRQRKEAEEKAKEAAEVEQASFDKAVTIANKRGVADLGVDEAEKMADEIVKSHKLDPQRRESILNMNPTVGAFNLTRRQMSALPPSQAIEAIDAALRRLAEPDKRDEKGKVIEESPATKLAMKNIKVEDYVRKLMQLAATISQAMPESERRPVGVPKDWSADKEFMRKTYKSGKRATEQGVQTKRALEVALRPGHTYLPALPGMSTTEPKHYWDKVRDRTFEE